MNGAVTVIGGSLGRHGHADIALLDAAVTHLRKPMLHEPTLHGSPCRLWRAWSAGESGTFDLIVVNYANGDMVGHTGNLEAAIRAVQTVDHCMGRLEAAVRRGGGCLLVTADHGNAEQMSDASTGQVHTAHTMNRVPLILVSGPEAIAGLADGRLADIAPTVLALMGLPQPEVMSGGSLIQATGSTVRA